MCRGSTKHKGSVVRFALKYGSPIIREVMFMAEMICEECGGTLVMTPGGGKCTSCGKLYRPGEKLDHLNDDRIGRQKIEDEERARREAEEAAKAAAEAGQA